MDNFQQRLETLHQRTPIEDGVQVVNGVTLSFADDCKNQAAASGCASSTAMPTLNGFGAHPGVSGTAAVTVWTAGSITIGSRDGSGGNDFQTTGLSAGIDRRINSAFTLGVGVGYGHDRTDVGDNGSTSKGDAYTLAVYGSYHPQGGLFVDGVAGHQWLSFDAHRFVTDDRSFVDGQRDGSQWFVSVTAGADLPVNSFTVTPFARVDLARASLDAYTETGNAAADLHYADQDIDTVTGNLGLKIAYECAFGAGVLKPEASLEYQHDFNNGGVVAIDYAGGFGPTYSAELTGVARDRIAFGAGATLSGGDNLDLSVTYRGTFADNYLSNAFGLGVSKHF